MAFVGRTDVKDPGAQQHQWERLALRRERLYARGCPIPGYPSRRSGRRDGPAGPVLRIAEAMATVMEGYADRPALGQRAREVITDPATGRSALSFLPRFDTISLWRTVGASARGGFRLAPPPRASGACRGLRLRARLRQHRLHGHRVGVHTPRCGRGAAANQRPGDAARADPCRDAAPNSGRGHRLSAGRGRGRAERRCACNV